MKRASLLILSLFLYSFCFIGTTSAQKKYKDSYNFNRAYEIITNQGDQNEALDYLFKEINEHPKNGYAHYIIGTLYAEHEMFEDALEPANQAVNLLKKDKEWAPFAYVLRADINLALGNETGALSDWKSAIKINPNYSSVYESRADYYCQKEMYDESDADYAMCCKLESDSPLGFLGLGRNALYKENYSDAVNYFTQAIKLDPEYSQSYAFRADASMNIGNISEAIDDIIKALEIDCNEKASVLLLHIEEPNINTLISKLKIQQNKQPESDYWPYYIGVVNELSGKYSKAIDAYMQSIALQPDALAYYRICCCYEALGLFEPALENLNYAIELEPDDDDYVSEKADILYDLGRVDEALQAYDQFIKNNPEFYGGYYRRGFIKDNIGDYEGAIEDYSLAIVLNPRFAYSYLGRADMYMLTNNAAAAKADYEMVIKLDTVPSEDNTAQYAYYGLGEYDKAKAFMATILEYSPSAGNCYDAACLYARMGMPDSSLYYLKQSFENGFSRFSHIRLDDDLESVRGMDEFEKLISYYEQINQEELDKRRKDNGIVIEREKVVSKIPFTVEGGNCFVMCDINGAPMRFVFDTGASEVSISMVEANYMLKNGFLSNRDILGSSKYVDANGDVSEGTVINLKKVKFGDVELDNVRASVVRNQKAPLLLGQSVLSRIGSIEIDNQRKVIILNYTREIKR